MKPRRALALAPVLFMLLSAGTCDDLLQLSSPSSPTVEAAFTWSQVVGGTAVQFIDESVGAVNSRRWDFGDGAGISSETNPLHRYARAGTYRVTLTACPGFNFEADDCSTASREVSVRPAA